MSTNLNLWESVEKTDPAQTKFVSQRGGFTAINPAYQAKKATEFFGPYGAGWGLTNIQLNFDHIEALGLVLIKADFFYTMTTGEKSSFEINNAEPPKNGARPDPDFLKKLETNTISKALSRLGFSADVFMGKFEDFNYLEERKAEAAIDSASNKDLAAAEAAKDLEEETKRVIDHMETLTTIKQLEGVFKAQARKVAKDQALARQLLTAKDLHKDRINNLEDVKQ